MASITSYKVDSGMNWHSLRYWTTIWNSIRSSIIVLMPPASTRSKLGNSPPDCQVLASHSTSSRRSKLTCWKAPINSIATAQPHTQKLGSRKVPSLHSSRIPIALRLHRLDRLPRNLCRVLFNTFGTGFHVTVSSRYTSKANGPGRLS